MANDKRLSRSVTYKNVQVKPATNVPISSFAPPKPVIVNGSTVKAVVVNPKKSHI